MKERSTRRDPGTVGTCSVEAVCTVYGHNLEGVLLDELLANTDEGLTQVGAIQVKEQL